MCNDNSIYVDPTWYGYYVEYEIDSEGAQEAGDMFEKWGGSDPDSFTKDPWSLGGLITAGRYGTVPGAVLWGIGWMIGKWGRDLKETDEGCGVRVKQRLVGTDDTIYVPFYTIEPQ